MISLKYIIEKEFIQLFRNKTVLVIVLLMPAIQLLILPLAANFDISNIRLIVVDHDRSSLSNKLISKVTATSLFNLVSRTSSYKAAKEQLDINQAEVIILIPTGFHNFTFREGEGKLQTICNAINPVEGVLVNTYVTKILQDFIQTERISPSNNQLEIINTNWYNRSMNYSFYMLPGIIAFLTTMVSVYLAAISVVREKETGTIEQLNVSPISKGTFLIGKMIPVWLIGIVTFSLGLLLSSMVYKMPIKGNLLTLYLFVIVYLITVISIGVCIALYTQTQHQAMFLCFFFMLIFILLSGLFTPIGSMPRWAQIIAFINPTSHFILFMRMVSLKGSSLAQAISPLGSILVPGIILNVWTFKKYNKRV